MTLRLALPEGYELVESRAGLLAVHRAYQSALAQAGFGPDSDPPWVPSGRAGRRPLGSIDLGEERLLVRRFHHGGMLRWLVDERFVRPERPFHELALSHALARRGIDTPLVVAARAQRAAPGWRLALVTVAVAGALDGVAVLERLAALPARRAALLERVGEFVGRLQAAGLEHSDLQPKNLLVDEALLAGGPGRIWVLDLDRCRLQGPLTDEARCRALARLFRYLERRRARAAAGERVPGWGDAARFLRAVQRGLGRPLATWREDWARVRRLERRGRLVHRTGWLLEELFGAGLTARTRSSAGGR